MSIGGDDEQVRLRINGEDLTGLYQSYSVAVSVFEQPAAFSITVGDGASVAEIRRRFKREDTFELLMGEDLIATGKIDGIDAHGSPSVVTFRGRDMCRYLLSNTAKVERSFQNETYFELTMAVLEEVGLGDALLFTNNDNARKKFSKVDPKKTKTTRLVEEISAIELAEGSTRTIGPITEEISPVTLGQETTRIVRQTTRTVRHVIKVEVGTVWWDFLQEQYSKVGLFLWCTPEGDFVLSEPNPNQEPAFRLLRRRGEDRNAVNVISASLSEGQPGSHGICVCYGKTGRGKNGRLTCRGEFRDEAAFAAGVTATYTFRDDTVTSDAQAEFVARRRIAEERRRDWRLEYTVAGHRALASQGITRGIWCPDTVVEVVDDEYGLNDHYYLYDVTFNRAPHTTTTLRFMRREDLLFAEEMAP